MPSVEEALATMERNIEVQTGTSVSAWVERLQGQGLVKHGEMVAWLKGEHGISHGYANQIAKRALTAAAPRSEDDPIAHVFEGDKSALRPLYEELVQQISAFGPDVEIAPKKANVSIRRRKQFALLQPSTRTRLDVGLILKDPAITGRLEASGSFNAMFTHRVRVSQAEEIDAELLGWLRAAYEQAG